MPTQELAPPALFLNRPLRDLGQIEDAFINVEILMRRAAERAGRIARLIRGRRILAAEDEARLFCADWELIFASIGPEDCTKRKHL